MSERPPTQGRERQVEAALREWVHESPLSRCNMGTDTCASWPVVDEIMEKVRPILTAAYPQQTERRALTVSGYCPRPDLCKASGKCGSEDRGYHRCHNAPAYPTGDQRERQQTEGDEKAEDARKRSNHWVKVFNRSSRTMRSAVKGLEGRLTAAEQRADHERAYRKDIERDRNHAEQETIEAEADKDRLQRENERLREVLRGFKPAWESKRLMRAGPCKLIKIALTDAETGAWARAEVAARQTLESKSSPNDSGAQ